MTKLKPAQTALVMTPTDHDQTALVMTPTDHDQTALVMTPTDHDQTDLTARIIAQGPIAQDFHMIFGTTTGRVAMVGQFTIGVRNATTAMTATLSIIGQAVFRTRGVLSIIGTRHLTGVLHFTGAGLITAIPFGTHSVSATTTPSGLSGRAMFINRKP